MALTSSEILFYTSKNNKSTVQIFIRYNDIQTIIQTVPIIESVFFFEN